MMNRTTKNKWYPMIVTGLSLIVIFAVLSALIMPADSMTIPEICNQTEHIHTEDCYELHSGTFENVLTCQMESGSVAHVHDGFCYKDDLLICPIAEMLHVHDDSCYQEDVLSCGIETHQHSEACYKALEASESVPVLVCGMNMHQHSEACYEAIQAIPQPERTAHPDEPELIELTASDSAVILADDLPMLTALSPDAIELNEENGTISSVSLSYEDYNEQIVITENNNTGLSASANYQLQVGYQNITVSDLKQSGHQMKYGPLPEWFRTTKTGVVFWGNEIVAQIEVTDGYIVVTFDEIWINTHADATTLNGSFKVSGEIDWRKLPENGEISSGFPSLDLSMSFEDDLASKYGAVQIEKSEPSLKELNGVYYLEYEITVASGEEVPMPEITVKDSFTANSGYIAGYVGITPGLQNDELNPTEISSEEVFTPGSCSIQNGEMLWTIGTLQPGEVRKLRYYAEIKPEYIQSMMTSVIRNRADVSSRDRLKDNDISNFAPKSSISLDKRLTDIQVDATTGNGTVSYMLTLTAPESNSFILSGLTLQDAFPEWLKEYLSGDSGEQITITINSRTSGTVESYTTNFENSSFILPDISISPGEIKEITYTIRTENIFAASNGDIDLKNVAAISGGGRQLRTATNTRTLAQSAWIRKITGTALSEELTISIPEQDDAYQYDGTPSNANAFTVPEGSQQYWVILNEDGRWDLSSAYMKDEFDNIYMKYSGYLQIQVFETPAVSSGTMITDTELISQLTNTPATKTIWLNIDGLSIFTIQPKALGLDQVKGYTFLLTYYAETQGTENMGSFLSGNSFSIWGDVGAGGSIAPGGMGVSVSHTVQGGLSYTAEKSSWYYEADVYQTEAVTSGAYPESEFNDQYKNGAIYWIIRLEGTISQGFTSGYNRNTVLSGFYVKDTPVNNQIVNRDAVVGVYVGSKFFDMTQYSSFEAFTQDGNGGLTKLRGNSRNDKYFHSSPTLVENPDYEWFAENGYLQGLIFPNGYTLGKGEAIYIVFRTAVSLSNNATLPTGSKGFMTFNNQLSLVSGNGNEMDSGTARYDYVANPAMYKESMGAYVYDADAGTWLTEQYSTPWTNGRPASQWGAALNQITESGTYAEWLLNINWDGSMEGSAIVSDFLPEGMELIYADIFWLGAGARNPRPTCDEIPELEDSAEWIKFTDNNSKGWGTAISYYHPETREIRWKINDLTKRTEDDPTFDKYQLNMQIICKVTDSDILLSRDGKIFENHAVTGDILETASVAINRNGSMNKSIDMTAIADVSDKNGIITGHLNELPFRIELNPLGEDLYEGDYLPALIDELGEKLELMEDSLLITYADETPVRGWTYMLNQAENGQQTLIISNLPDNVKLIITYKTRITAEKNTPVDITNNAYWNGYPSPNNPQIKDKRFQYDLYGVVFTEANIEIEITKIDSEYHSRVLSGAEFEVYQIEDGTETLVRSGVTGTNGKLKFSNNDSEINLYYNTLYCLREVKAPNGYILDTTPHYFVIATGDDEKAKLLAGYKNTYPDVEIWYSGSSYKYTCKNQKGKISVEKLFRNEDGTPAETPISGSYRFGLYDVQHTLLEVLTIEYTSEGIRYYLDDVLQTVPDGEKPYFTNYEPDFVYYVYELDSSGQPIQNDSLGNASGMTYHVSYYIDDNPELKNLITVNSTIRIVNQENPILLPESGGIGSFSYHLTGILLMLISLTALLIRKHTEK